MKLTIEEKIGSLMTNLSEHFTLKEMTQSETATKLNIDNTPKPWQIDNMRTLCNLVLEPLREQFGPITVTSGFRSARLNKAVGGSLTSQHTKGEAADLRIGSPERGQAMFEWIRKNIVFDQLIMERSRHDGAQWLHVSRKRERKLNRQQAFSLCQK